MNTRPRVLLDCDGPLADFQSHYLKALAEVTGQTYRPGEIDRFAIHECPFFVREAEAKGWTPGQLRAEVDRAVSAPGFCESIPVAGGAAEAVAELHEIAEVWVVTSPWDSSPTWMYERHRWLQKHLGIRKDHIIQCGRKIAVQGEVFVDDKASHVREWQQEWPFQTAVLFDMVHNAREVIDDRSMRGGWSTVLNAVRSRIQQLEPPAGGWF